jgi:hypothetical protein
MVKKGGKRNDAYNLPGNGGRVRGHAHVGKPTERRKKGRESDIEDREDEGATTTITSVAESGYGVIDGGKRYRAQEDETCKMIANSLDIDVNELVAVNKERCVLCVFCVCFVCVLCMFCVCFVCVLCVFLNRIIGRVK